MKRGRPPHPGILTLREQEVLALLREELSNVEIAERLGISRATAAYHVSEILSKLGVNSRQEAAAWRPERGVLGVALLRGLMKRSSRESFVRTTTVALAGGVTAIFAIASALLLLHDRPVAHLDTSTPGTFSVGTTIRSTSWTLPDGTTRNTDYRVWYPANVRNPGPAFVGAAANFPLVTVEDAPMTYGSPRPLILFSAPFAWEAENISYLLTHWASYGFIVAAPIHRDCVAGPPPDCPNLGIVRSGELTAMLADLGERNSGSEAFLNGSIDMDRVGIAGWELGGYAALSAIAQGHRFVATVLLTPLTENAAGVSLVVGPVSVPTMLIGADWSNPTITRGHYALTTSGLPATFASSLRFFDRLPVSTERWFVDIHRATNILSNMNCAAIVAGVNVTCDAMTPQDEIARIVKHWSTAFLLRYVAGDDRFIGALDPRSFHDANATIVRGGPGEMPAALPTPITLP